MPAPLPRAGGPVHLERIGTTSEAGAELNHVLRHTVYRNGDGERWGGFGLGIWTRQTWTAGR